VRRVLQIVALGAALAGEARADRELCPVTTARGATIDIDVRGAELQDVLRMLADTGHVNIAMGSDIAGKVTLKLKRVAWDQAACAIADLYGLAITLDGNILLVKKRAK